MLIRRAKQKMTGRSPYRLEVVLGERADGQRQVKIDAGWDTYICIYDPAQLSELRNALDTAARYLDGKPVILDGEEG